MTKVKKSNQEKCQIKCTCINDLQCRFKRIPVSSEATL